MDKHFNRTAAAVSPEKNGNRPRTNHGTALVAWLLLIMAVTAFTPCVLLPEWRAYQAVCIAEQAARHRLDSLQRIVDHEERLLLAIQTDPAVVARLAQRELHFTRLGDQSVYVSPQPSPPLKEPAFEPAPVQLPAPLQRAAASLPDLDYDAVFCDNRTRILIIAMSIALMGVAVWLPKRTTPSRGR